ncbi:MAG: PfkB domain protein [Glaciihabitans sp.]|nr:PfkB domain protein [Glaciihabitans sp.]
MARVVVVTPNPAVDITYRVATQVIGETVRVQSVTRRPGGKGINVVRVLRQLGLDAMAVQPLGGANGAWIREQLAHDGIRTVSVDSILETRTTVAVVDNIAHPTLYSESGGALTDETWAGLTDAVSQSCESGGFLVVAGSLPHGTSNTHVARLVAAGRAAGALVIVDVSGPALLAAADSGADIVKPNESELLDATGAPTLEQGLTDLLNRGAGAAIVSRGSSGLLLAEINGARTLQPGVPGVSGNPTGAGDAATAGLVFALAAGSSLADALLSAAVVGAAAVLSPTAGEINPDDLAPLALRLGGRSLPPIPVTFHPDTTEVK